MAVVGTMTIDTILNDDWLKSLPSAKNEVEISANALKNPVKKPVKKSMHVILKTLQSFQDKPWASVDK